MDVGSRVIIAVPAKHREELPFVVRIVFFRRRRILCLAALRKGATTDGGQNEMFHVEILLV
jgi:hypothetical protein